MDYVITFSDVMAGVMTLAIGALGFFIKSWLNGVKNEIADVKKQQKENDDKISTRIDRLEDKTNAEIENIKMDMNGIKGEFATTFVLREDFFRSMNGVEDVIHRIDGKVDRLLTNSAGGKG